MSDLLPSPQAKITAERIQMSIRLRFNPIRGLTPELLAQYLDSFRLGFFRNAALTWDAMERRDSRLQTVAPKRKKSVARRGWEILTVEDSPAAKAQQAKLEYFYNHLTATTALEPNEQGGLSLLLRQMMDAVGKRYAVHEIVWQPSVSPVAPKSRPRDDGGSSSSSSNASGVDSASLHHSNTPSVNNLTASFRFCPLWWFEGTKGKLRFLLSEFDLYGQDMEEGGWLVTVGDGLMEACSVAYLFKTLPLRDWLIYSEKFGMPGLLGKTDATLDSPEWNAFADAMQSFASDWAAICSTTNDIQLIESHNRGAQPFEPLIARMDEEMTRLWRGSDLATSSKANGTGASLQADEAEILEADDAQMLSETLTAQVSRFVLRYFFGDAPQLAYLKIHSLERKATAEDLKVDDFLLRAGFPISRESAAERYDRPIPETSADLLTAPATPAITPSANDETNLNN